MEKVIKTSTDLIINGILFNIAKLIRQSRFIKKGNTKVGNMWTWATLFGCIDWFIPEMGISVKGTCGSHCAGCFNKKNWRKSPCYVAKSYYKNINHENGFCSPRLGHARRTLAIRYLLNELYDALRLQIIRAKNKPDIIRINVSGEIECKEQLEMFCKLAREFDYIQFYVYSKNYDVVVPMLLNNEVPENMTINISIWHECGIAAYNKVKHLSNVKAFVYDDFKFDYAAAGLIINGYCPAYDINGKMIHEITCDKCKKCFNRCSSCKVNGCYDH